MPPFDREESIVWIAHLARHGALPGVTMDMDQLTRIHHLSGGNARDIRRHLPGLLKDTAAPDSEADAALRAM